MIDLSKYDKLHVETMNHVRNRLENSKCSKLLEWIITTDINPYCFLTHSRAHWLQTICGVSSLFHEIEHALYDDGDITFVTVDNEPRIVFAWQHEDGFREKCLSSSEISLENDSNLKIDKYEVKILNDIDPNDFPDLYEQYEKERLIKAEERRIKREHFLST